MPYLKQYSLSREMSRVEKGFIGAVSSFKLGFWIWNNLKANS